MATPVAWPVALHVALLGVGSPLVPTVILSVSHLVFLPLDPGNIPVNGSVAYLGDSFALPVPSVLLWCVSVAVAVHGVKWSLEASMNS